MKIGILGAGQLGRMMALAGIPLGHTFRFLDPVPSSPASVAGEQLAGSYEDTELLNKFIAGIDVVTYEFENVSALATQYLTGKVDVFPPTKALEITQDRIFEKTFFKNLGVPVTDFYEINNKTDLKNAVEKNGFPCILKTRRMGYDGKGQFLLKSNADVYALFEEVEIKNMILENFVKFNRELSIIAVRGVSGQTKSYSLVENTHAKGILRLSIAPADNVSVELQAKAEKIATDVMNAMNYIGVMAIEFFDVNGVLYANEMACRVHNSGHWTIEGAETSQFENHIRAVSGMPLGSTRNIGFSAMFNILGSVPETTEMLETPGLHFHLYGKEPRKDRKIGHITLRADSKTELTENIEKLKPLFFKGLDT